MVDSEGDLVYVGQSHALRDRLLSYFGGGAPGKARRIIAHTHRLLWEPVVDPFAALLRELELIRRWRPRFNVRGQPGRNRAAYVVVGRGPAPSACLTSQLGHDERAVFGPLRASRTASRAVELLNHCFQLRNCGEQVAVRFADDPRSCTLSNGDTSVAREALCLRYDLGTCLGPCTGSTTRAQYASQVAAMQMFLRGDNDQPIHRIQAQMLQAAQEQRDERAGAVRDLLRALEYLRSQIDRFRDARLKHRFVYPLAGSSKRPTWYFVHRGQVIGATIEPRSSRERAASLEMLSRLEDDCVDSVTSHAGDDFEMQWLVSCWFRCHPDDLAKTMSPEQLWGGTSSP